MLTFGIRYLNGFAAATEPGDYDRVEWPPHPGRVFMALTAAHFQTGGRPAEREALLWLERLGPPALHAPAVTVRAVVTHYVPVNDRSGPSTALMHSLPLTRDRQPRTFTRAWLDHDTVFMAWPDADPDQPIRAALGELCAKVARLGHSTSLVQMWLASSDEAAEPNWLPDEERATLRMRLAAPGTLADLERRYNGEAVEAFCTLKAAEDQKETKKRLKAQFPSGPPLQLRPQLSFYQGYAPPQNQEEASPGTIFAPQLQVFRLERESAPYAHLDLLCSLAVTQRWREALCSQTNDLSQTVRELVSGHLPEGAPLDRPHLAFVPLGFVGSEHADGRLLGMACALPAELSREDRHGLLHPLCQDRQRQISPLELG